MRLLFIMTAFVPAAQLVAVAFHSPVSLTTNTWHLRHPVSSIIDNIMINPPYYWSTAFSKSLFTTATTLTSTSSRLSSSLNNNRPTELPDSLDDAAAIAANACHQLLLVGAQQQQQQQPIRCRVDFDTSVGDETYTPLKRSSEFMLAFVNALCLASIDGVREWKQDCVLRVMEAKQELMELKEKRRIVVHEEEEEKRRLGEGFDDDETTITEDNNIIVGESSNDEEEQRESELLQIIAREGKLISNSWNGKRTLRIYFPDEGSAALARRDWTSILPPCVVYDACGGVANRDMKEKRSDVISIFYCPRASESESVEKLLLEAEESSYDSGIANVEDEDDSSSGGGAHKMTIMVNPLLVDMGVTGFGMAGRRLRERLIDGLIPAYYLRTLEWGALTRCYPNLFTVWMEDENEETGYRMIQAMDRLPSNPEVEDIYDIATGNMNAPKEGLGFLNALGDFVNGMTRL